MELANRIITYQSKTLPTPQLETTSLAGGDSDARLGGVTPQLKILC